MFRQLLESSTTGDLADTSERAQAYMSKGFQLTFHFVLSDWTGSYTAWTIVLYLQMAFHIRSSKFRHVYGDPHRKERCYENVRLTRNAHDSNFCAVNPKYLAVVTESSGGGAFIVLPLARVSTWHWSWTCLPHQRFPLCPRARTFTLIA